MKSDRFRNGLTYLLAKQQGPHLTPQNEIGIKLASGERRRSEGAVTFARTRQHKLFLRITEIDLGCSESK